MDMERFESLAEAWGGDITRWPDETQQAAREFLATNETAQQVLADAARLDAVLADIGDETFAPSDLLERRILKSAPLPAFERDWRRPAIAAAAALVIGIASGFGGGFFVPTTLDTSTDYEYADAYDGLLEDWSAWEWSDA